MPPQVQSNEALRRAFAKADTSNKPSMMEQEKARSFRRLQMAVEYLRSGAWDGKTIVLPLPRNMLNDGRPPWYVLAALKKQYADHCHALGAANLLPKPPKHPHAYFRAEVTFYLHQAQDVDNLHARMKYPLDFLKGAGWMEDDDPAHCSIAMMPQQIDRQFQRIEFKVVPWLPAPATIERERKEKMNDIYEGHNEWISVSECLPQFHVWVLVQLDRYGVSGNRSIAQLCTDKLWRWATTVEGHVTHWMPMPPSHGSEPEVVETQPPFNFATVVPGQLRD